MTIAITGANGQLGRLIIERLREKAPQTPLIALVRDPSKAADLGVEIRQADYNLPDTLDQALAGVDILMMISGSEVGQRVAQHRNLIDAAKKAGVRRVVYTSLLNADRSTLLLAPEHVDTEAMLAASGLSVTLLRNGWYTENYTAAVGAAV
ncbi:MAG: NAD(P)H-binding protein, partial [Pigmentiphaga sp.]